MLQQSGIAVAEGRQFHIDRRLEIDVSVFACALEDAVELHDVGTLYPEETRRWQSGLEKTLAGVNPPRERVRTTCRQDRG
jgi:hypothetical protein